MAAELDLVIRNGVVVDGSGRAGYRADVAVANGRIVDIGRISDSGREELDADGHVVTPGFIDGHTHMDAQVFWDPLGTCSSWHGVTTAIMGHCGFTVAPIRAGRRDLAIRSLARAEDIPADVLEVGIPWTWTSFGEYLDAIDATPKGINYAANIGHSALRAWAMGDDAFERAATDEEIAAMGEEVTRALAAGAIGFSTSRSPNHETLDDRPVASRFAAWDEVRRLVTVVGAAGHGIFQLAPEAEMRSDDAATRLDSERRLRELAVDTGVPIAFGVPPRRHGVEMLSLIDATAAAGGRMFGLSHSRGVTLVLSFRTQLPFDRLPGWREVRSQDLDGQRRLLRDPVVRERLVREAHEGDYGRSVGAEARRPDYDTIRVLDDALPPNRSVAEVAAERGVHPVEAMIDLALERDFDRFFLQSERYADDVVVQVMKHPRTVMTFSDSGAHASQIMDASIQTYLLAYWVRERQVFTFEEAVQLVTWAPASAWGLWDRGLVAPGYVADLNVIDPATVRPNLPEVVTDLPGGATRLKQTAAGIAATVVGGQVLLRSGEPTGVRPGKLIRAGS